MQRRPRKSNTSTEAGTSRIRIILARAISNASTGASTITIRKHMFTGDAGPVPMARRIGDAAAPRRGLPEARWLQHDPQTRRSRYTRVRKYTAVLLSTLGIVVPNTRYLVLDEKLTGTLFSQEMIFTALPHQYPSITHEFLYPYNTMNAQVASRCATSVMIIVP